MHAARIEIEDGMKNNPIYYSNWGQAPQALPYISADQYPVTCNYGHQGTAYPSDQFSYEMAPGTTTNYFPQHHLDTAVPVVHETGSTPNITIQKSSGLENLNRKYHYPLGGSADIANNIISKPNNDQLDLISPGEQSNWFHRDVRQNRYDAQTPVSNIYMTPSSLDAEPYTPSLWQTPYDSSKNVISVGIMSNPYTGELTEIFQDQMPGPTTVKGQMLESQLQHPNPKLIAMSGGFNHHNPPPRKTEQPGYVFNPVSVRGGSTPFGSQVYAPIVQREMTARTSRDVYNNRDGELPLEQGFAREQPHGYIGYVPRIRFNPYVPPTQELEYGDYYPPMQDQPTDLTKREQYTFESFAYKDPALVTDRLQYANQNVNGTDATASSPTDAEHTGPQRSDWVNSYVGPIGISAGATVVTGKGQKEPNKILDALPTIGAGGLAVAGAVVADLQVRSTLNNQSALPTAPPTAMAGAGLVVSDLELRETLKTQSALPTAPANQSFLSGLVVADLQLRDTLKHNAVALPTSAVGGGGGGGSGGHVFSELDIRVTNKGDKTLRTGPLGSENLVSGAVMSDLVLRDTLKVASMETAPRIVAAPSVDGTGYVLVDKNAQQTDRSMTSAVGNIDGGRFEVGVGPSHGTVLNYRGKEEQAYIPSQAMVPVAAGDVATRVVAPLQRSTHRIDVGNVVRDVLTSNVPTISIIGTGLKTTQRAEQEPRSWSSDVQDI